MKFKVKKTDKRHAGHLQWMYFIESTMHNKLIRQHFFQWREWCWDQWGPSKELNRYDHDDLFDGVACSNPKWCWLTDGWRSRIYFRSESEASMFSLRWYD